MNTAMKSLLAVAFSTTSFGATIPSHLQGVASVESIDCVQAPDGIVAWWRASGDASDFVGGNNGTFHGSVTFAPGKVGQAFSFDGNGCVRVPDSPSLRCTNALTIEAWIYPADVGGYHEIVSRWVAGYTTSVYPDGRIYLAVFDSGPGSAVTIWSTNAAPLNQWTHFAGTYDGSALRIYINGICEGQIPYNRGIFPGSCDLSIGSVGGYYTGPISSAFIGRIDEPAVYNRALSATEIQAIYNAGYSGKCSAVLIRRQPRSQLGFWGKSITFGVAAVGSAPLTYQWQKDGSSIGGATNDSLTITNLRVTDAGSYTVIIANINGSLTSNPAFLTVNPAGVAIALYAGITIDGVVGLTYGIQYSTDLSDTNNWRGVVNIPLSTPTQIWFDMQPVNGPQRYYRVVPGPIPIP